MHSYFFYSIEALINDLSERKKYKKSFISSSHYVTCEFSFFCLEFFCFGKFAVKVDGED